MRTSSRSTHSRGTDSRGTDSRNTGRSRRRAAGAGGLILLAVAASTALAACSGSSSSSGAASSAAALGPGPAASAVPSAPAAAASASASAPAAGLGAAEPAGSNARGAATVKYVPDNQDLIYTAQLTVRAASVAAAVSQVTSIVGDAGGYVSSENASSDPAHPSAATATVTVKIPVAVYQTTLAELTGPALGTQLSLTQQAQDVTQQVADVNSQVTSDEAAIAQLRALLKRAGSVGDLLTVQNQIDSQENALESMLAQQSALDHETAYATVTVTVVGPVAVVKPKPKPKPAPPPTLARGLSRGWHAFVVTVDWLLATLGAIAPFLAAIVVIGGGGWWLRRWLIVMRGR
jgi:hypothetical protein